MEELVERVAKLLCRVSRASIDAIALALKTERRDVELAVQSLVVSGLAVVERVEVSPSICTSCPLHRVCGSRAPRRATVVESVKLSEKGRRVFCRGT